MIAVKGEGAEAVDYPRNLPACVEYIGVHAFLSNSLVIGSA